MQSASTIRATANRLGLGAGRMRSSADVGAVRGTDVMANKQPAKKAAASVRLMPAVMVPCRGWTKTRRDGGRASPRRRVRKRAMRQTTEAAPATPARRLNATASTTAAQCTAVAGGHGWQSQAEVQVLQALGTAARNSTRAARRLKPRTNRMLAAGKRLNERLAELRTLETT